MKRHNQKEDNWKRWPTPPTSSIISECCNTGAYDQFIIPLLSLQSHLLFVLETALKAGLKEPFASDPIYYFFILRPRRGWRAQAYMKEQWNYRALRCSIFAEKHENASPSITFSITCYASACQASHMEANFTFQNSCLLPKESSPEQADDLASVSLPLVLPFSHLWCTYMWGNNYHPM